jgi:ATP-binding cassette subfamily B protein
VQVSDRLVLQTFRHAGPWPAVIVVTSLAGSALQLALPFVLGSTVDAVIASRHSADAWVVVALAVIGGLVGCETLDSWAAGASGALASARLRRRMVASILGVGPSVVGRLPEGELATRIGLNAEETGQAPQVVVTGAALLLPTAGSLVALVLIDVWLALTLLAGLILVAFVMRAFLRDTTEIAGGYQRAQGEIAARLTDALTGARTIAAAGTAEQETTRVLRPLPALRARGMELWRVNAQAGMKAGLTVPLVEAAVLAVGGVRMAHGGLTAGQLYEAARYAVLGAGLSSALGYVATLARARSAAARVAEVLAERPVEHGVRSLPDGPGALELRGVVLPFHTEPLDVTVEGGSMTAVVGRSGAGKSLLAAVAARLADPVAGEVRLDGVPLPELSHASLRRAIGYAPERPTLVGETLADAIGLGGAPGRVGRAAEDARADSFIRPMPAGYATRVADAPLSGGERQRIGLARAFAQGERLLVLDDATSSLDTVAERQVSGALAGGGPGGRTRLVVTHRAAIAARADRVLWLEDGRVRAYDRHRVLWRDPAYRAVFQPDAEAVREEVAG